MTEFVADLTNLEKIVYNADTRPYIQLLGCKLVIRL
jgi:hypothetical protein